MVNEMIDDMTLDELKMEYEIAKQRFHSHMSIKNGARLQELRSKIIQLIQLADEHKDDFQQKEEYNDNQEEEQEREKCSQR